MARARPAASDRYCLKRQTNLNSNTKLGESNTITLVPRSQLGESNTITLVPGSQLGESNAITLVPRSQLGESNTITLVPRSQLGAGDIIACGPRDTESQVTAKSCYLKSIHSDMLSVTSPPGAIMDTNGAQAMLMRHGIMGRGNRSQVTENGLYLHLSPYCECKWL
jgi:hypothetical protein